MNILYLCSDPGIPILGQKGAAIHVRELISAFQRVGHRVTVATPILNKSPWEEPSRLDAMVLHLPAGRHVTDTVRALKGFNDMLAMESPLPGEMRRILHNQDMVAQITRRFDETPPDFIYERASLYGTVGVSLARELKRPLFLEVNAPLALEQSTYRATGLGELAKQAEHWVVQRAEVVLTVSGVLRDYMTSLGVEPCRVHVIPNGVDPTLFRPAPPDPNVRARWGLDGGPVLGFVGGLRPWHGVEILPALLERLVHRYRDIRLVIVGDGPLRGELERGLQARGLTRNAILTGSLPHEEVAELIRQFDVALAPYPQAEHAFYFSPLKLFEYMACGVPVVAAGLGQISEVVQDGETGLLYPPDDLDILTAACDGLLADPAFRERLGQAATKEIHDRYTWDRNAKRVTDLARELLANRRIGR